MYMPGNSRERFTAEVKIIQGIPMIVFVYEPELDSDLETDGDLSTAVEWSRCTTPRGFGAAWKTGPKRVNGLNGVTRIPGTEMYQCNDCDYIYGLYTDNPEPDRAHFQYGGGQCLSFKAINGGQENELLIIQGKLRFMRGYVAFPQFVFYSEYGCMTIDGTRHCIVCGHKPGEGHPDSNCDNMKRLLKIKLTSLKLHENMDTVRLFSTARSTTWGLIECDGISTRCTTDFSILGPRANMQYIHGTVDSHQCFQCGITVSNFVENDTLLGEHIHHSNGSCPYIAREFKNQKGELDAIMGKERYRRGHIAIPDLAIQAHYGRIGSRGARSCVICSAIERTHLPANGHYSYCDAMKESLRKKLNNMCMV